MKEVKEVKEVKERQGLLDECVNYEIASKIIWRSIFLRPFELRLLFRKSFCKKVSSGSQRLVLISPWIVCSISLKPVFCFLFIAQKRKRFRA